MKIDSFNVLVRRKIPYITNAAFVLIVICVLFIVVADLFMMPSRNSPQEMQMLWLFKVVPQLIGNGLLVGLGGLIILFPLYKWLRIYRSATFSFSKDSMNIQGEKLNLMLPVNSVKKIYWQDKNDKFVIQILLNTGKQITVKLSDYGHAEDFSNALMQCAGKKNYYNELCADFPFGED
jgi:hypothetical protein